MLKIIVAGLVVLVAAFVAAVAMQPSEFRVVRTATIAAPAPAVFAQVNDFRNWDAWSPWARLDPGMKVTYGGPPAGAGASYAWAGNSHVGEGRMTILESRPNERITIQLEFVKPFVATNIAQFGFEPQGDRTAVTWTMTGTNTFTGKAIGLFMNMDRMVGGQFEQGLAQMKSVVEARRG
jgi:hypothetical protein